MNQANQPSKQINNPPTNQTTKRSIDQIIYQPNPSNQPRQNRLALSIQTIHQITQSNNQKQATQPLPHPLNQTKQQINQTSQIKSNEDNPIQSNQSFNNR